MNELADNFNSEVKPSAPVYVNSTIIQPTAPGPGPVEPSGEATTPVVPSGTAVPSGTGAPVPSGPAFTGAASSLKAGSALVGLLGVAAYIL